MEQDKEEGKERRNKRTEGKTREREGETEHGNEGTFLLLMTTIMTITLITMKTKTMLTSW